MKAGADGDPSLAALPMVVQSPKYRYGKKAHKTYLFCNDDDNDDGGGGHCKDLEVIIIII